MRVSAFPNRAFTLVELAIVLVIIGLIVGGVLVGQDLIALAGARSLMKQMEGYQAAVSTFRTKYNCMPGDCLNANDSGLGPNGNGDGTIGCGTGSGRLTDPSTTVCYNKSFGGMTNSNMVRSTGEPNYFFMHLSAAGLISDSISQNPGGNVSTSMDLYFPKAATGKGYLHVLTWSNVTYIRTGIFGTDASGNPLVMGGGALSGQQAQYITQKLDENPQDMMEPGCLGASLCAAAPPILFKGRVAIAGAERNGGPAGGYFYLSPNYNSTGVGTCMNNNGGTYSFNLTIANNCNLIWKIDY